MRDSPLLGPFRTWSCCYHKWAFGEYQGTRTSPVVFLILDLIPTEYHVQQHLVMARSVPLPESADPQSSSCPGRLNELGLSVCGGK